MAPPQRICGYGKEIVNGPLLVVSPACLAKRGGLSIGGAFRGLNSPAESMATSGGTTAPVSETEAKARIFISYSRSDMAFVDRLEPALIARGFEVMIDREQIYAFEDWWTRLKSLINQADTVVFSLSPDWLSSKVCKQEIDYATSLSKRFAPIVSRTIDPTTAPIELSRLNFIFFNDETQFEQSLDRLVDALQTDIGWVRKHTEYGEAARRWDEAGRSANSGLLLRSHVLVDAERWIASRPPGAPSPTEATQAFIAASRRAATRRRNMLSGSLAAGLVVALALAVWAWRERGIAITQRELAQRNFDAAKSTVDSVVTDIAQGLREVQGMRVDTVRRILGRAEAALNELASNTGNDPQVRMSQAEMDTLFANTYLRLGAIKLATSYAQKGNAVIRPLAASQPGDVDYQQELAINLNEVGEVDEEAGDTVGALSAYREGLDLMRAVAAKEPDAPNVTSNLDVSLAKVGKVLAQQGDLANALAAHQEAIVLMRARIAKEPDSTEWQYNLAGHLNFAGDLMAQQGDLDGGLKTFREGLGIARNIAAKDPDNTERQRDVEVDLGSVGDVLSAQGNGADALASYKESLDTSRTLLTKDPANAQWLNDVAKCLNKYGGQLRNQGDMAGALAAFNEQLDTQRKLTAKDAENTEWQNDLAIALTAVGDIMFAQGNNAGALAAFAESLGIARKLAAKDKDNTYWQGNVTVSLTRHGDVLAAQGNSAGALADYRESVDIDRALAAKNPDDGEAQHNLGLSLDRLGDALLNQKDQDGALSVYNEGLSLRTTLHAKFPKNPEWQADVSFSQTRIGVLQYQQGNYTEAVKNFQVAHDNCEAVAKTDPSNTEWQYNLALSFGKLSDGYNGADQNDKSMDAAQQAHTIMVRLNKVADVAAWKDTTGRLERRMAFLIAHGVKEPADPATQQQPALPQQPGQQAPPAQ